jgi:hypothetical protein
MDWLINYCAFLWYSMPDAAQIVWLDVSVEEAGALGWVLARYADATGRDPSGESEAVRAAWRATRKDS